MYRKCRAELTGWHVFFCNIFCFCLSVRAQINNLNFLLISGFIGHNISDIKIILVSMPSIINPNMEHNFFIPILRDCVALCHSVTV